MPDANPGLLVLRRLTEPPDLRFAVGHAEAHAGHALRDSGQAGCPQNAQALRQAPFETQGKQGKQEWLCHQGLRMRGNPELDVFHGANDQVREGIQNVGMQARLRFVDRQ